MAEAIPVQDYPTGVLAEGSPNLFNIEYWSDIGYFVDFAGCRFYHIVEVIFYKGTYWPAIFNRGQYAHPHISSSYCHDRVLDPIVKSLVLAKLYRQAAMVIADSLRRINPKSVFSLYSSAKCGVCATYNFELNSCTSCGRSYCRDKCSNKCKRCGDPGNKCRRCNTQGYCDQCARFAEIYDLGLSESITKILVDNNITSVINFILPDQRLMKIKGIGISKEKYVIRQLLLKSNDEKVYWWLWKQTGRLILKEDLPPLPKSTEARVRTRMVLAQALLDRLPPLKR